MLHAVEWFHETYGCMTKQRHECRLYQKTKDVLVVVKDVIIDELQSHPVDTVPWTNAAVYLGAMLFFGVDPLKAAVTAGVVALAISYNYGRRTLIRGGVVVLFFTLTVWVGIIPDPANWGRLVHSFVAGLRQ